jgi:hypothetical protein
MSKSAKSLKSTMGESLRQSMAICGPSSSIEYEFVTYGIARSFISEAEMVAHITGLSVDCGEPA